MWKGAPPGKWRGDRSTENAVMRFSSLHRSRRTGASQSMECCCLPLPKSSSLMVAEIGFGYWPWSVRKAPSSAVGVT